MYGRLVAVPRLECYLDSPGQLPHPVLLEAHRRLDAQYGDDPAGPFTSADLVLYRGGRDTVPWHGDPFVTPEPTEALVALIVLGPARRVTRTPAAVMAPAVSNARIQASAIGGG
jgi:hypothetical protein